MNTWHQNTSKKDISQIIVNNNEIILITNNVDNF